MTDIAIYKCKLGAANHSISNASLNEPDAYDSLKGTDAPGAFDSLKRSSSNHPYGGSDAARTYDSLKRPDAYDSLNKPDAAGTYGSLKLCRTKYHIAMILAEVFKIPYKAKYDILPDSF